MVTLDDPRIRDVLDDDEQLPRMSFGDHLDELRKRVIRSLLAIGIAIVALLPFKQGVTEIIIGPYRVAWLNGFEDWVGQLRADKEAGTLDPLGQEFLSFCVDNYDVIVAGAFEYPQVLKERSGFALPYTLYATGGLEDMLAFMWASLIFALVIASPVVIWQVWAFVAAGLYKHERAVFYRYFPFMMGLATVGVLFGYRIVLPFSLGFLVSLMDPSQVGAIFSVGQFLSLLFITTAAMSLVFQLPLIMLALQKVGLVTHTAFKKNWRVTIVIIACVSAVFTPPEPVSMVLMMVPMVLLYGIGLLLTSISDKNRRAQDGASGAPA